MMNTIVLDLDLSQRKKLVQHYHSYHRQSKNPHMEAFFSVEGTSISVYSSGKVVFQGKQAATYAAEWGYQPEVENLHPTATPVRSMIGTDEVGNGSYFGGLAVVASFVQQADQAFLHSLGVDDSKKMTDKHICRIAPLLKEKIPHQALLLSPKKYNQVIEQGYNAVSVKVALHNQAIYLLLQKGIAADRIVIDAFTSQKNYENYLRTEKNQFSNPVHLEEKAEGKYLAVAVSSILARAMFLENLRELGQEIGFTLPSGAGFQSDRVASQILQRHGLSGLSQTAKLHFANTKKAQRLLK